MMLRGTNRRGYMDIDRLSEEDWLRCPICLDIFQTPRALACLHTFCEQCLGMYMSDCRASAKDGKLLQVECPICNHPTIPVDSRKHVHSMVKDFPINHFILPFTDMSLNKTKHSEKEGAKKKSIQFLQYCASCSERGVHEEAVVYCNDCGDFQCNECVENHAKMKFLTRHKFVRVERVNDVSQYVSFFDKRINCKDHQKEELRFYCVDHDILLCSICGFENHKACEMVTEFGELGQQLKDKGQHKALRNNLKGLQMALRDMVEAARTNNYTLMRESEEIPKRIQQTKAKILRMFDYLEDSANKTIRKYQQEYGKKNSERALKCKQLMCAIESSCAALDTLMIHGTNHQLFCKFQVLKDHLQSFDDLVQKEKEQLECVSIKLQMHEAVDSLVGLTDALGHMYVEHVSPEVVNVPQLQFTKQEEEKMPDEKPLLAKSSQISERDKHKIKVCISACCIKRIIAMIIEVRNRTWLTYSLVLLDSKTLTQILSTDIKRDPKNAIAFDATTVAVTYPSAGMIEFYVYTPKKKKTPASLSLNRTMKCDIRDAILTKYKNNEFALTTGNFFGIMTQDGTLKQSFYYSVSLRTRENDFWSTQLAVVCMCVDIKRKRVYVASTNPDKLYSMTIDGRVMFEYEAGANVTSIDIDKDGKIYLCCHNNGEGKVSKVSPSTGKLISDVTVEMTKPSLLCFDRKGGRFNVIENKGKEIKVDKYEFQSIVEDEESEED